MGPPSDSSPDQRPESQTGRIRHSFSTVVPLAIFLCTFCVIPFVFYRHIVTYLVASLIAMDESVDLERMGWRFEGRYEGVLGIVTRYSNLTYHGSKIGQSLPDDVNLVTPIGEFLSGQHGWHAAWSDPQIWDDAYRLPDVKDGEPWVRQVEHKRDTEEFLSRGFYQAPETVSSYGVPWKDRQLKGTPADWVYVYRLSWRDRQNDDYESHAVTGYWADPAHFNDLKWE